MGDLDRRSRKLVQGWPSGGLVVGLLPDSSHREWSGAAALELATAAANDRLAALVLDLAPDASDLASRFGADPEPGFAQVMTGEVELSEIQHWDPVRGAYYLPGGVRVLSDKVAKSRSVKALADRVRGQEGVLFVLLDRHAAEAAAEAGWLDGVVRLGEADLGGPKMFGEVTALGHLERRESTTRKPWEREQGEPAASEPSTAGPSAGERADTGATEDAGEADLTVEPEEPREPAAADGAGPTPGPDEPGPEQPAEEDRPLEPAASAEPDRREAAEEPEVSEPEAAEAEADVGDPQPALEVVDGAEADEADAGDEEESPPAPPVLEVPDALWEAREVEEPGITAEPEIVAEDDEVDAGAEVEAEEEPREEVLTTEAAGGPEVDEAPEEPADREPLEPEASAEEPDESEVTEEAELRPEEGREEPGEPEVAETAEEAADPETADGAEVETDEVEADEEPAEPEVTETGDERADREVVEPEVGAEPEIAEPPAEEADSDERAAEVGDTDEVAEPEIVPDGAGDDTGDVEVAEQPAEPEIAEEAEVEADEEPAEPEVAPGAEPAETEVAGDSEVTESPEETAEEELGRPAGLERFAEIPGEDETPQTDEAPAAEAAPDVGHVEEDVPDEDVLEKDVPDADGADEDPAPEPRSVEEPGEPVHAEVITSGLDVWPEQDEPVPSGDAGESGAPEPSAAGDETEETPEPAASVISAAPWVTPEEDGGSGEEEEPESADFITPAMWISETDDAEGAASPRAEGAGSAEIVSRASWAPAGGAQGAAESSASPEDGGDAAAAEPVEAEDAADEADEGDEGDDEPQRADFILDGLELPPEWSEEWEEEERAAEEARSDTRAADAEPEEQEGDGPEEREDEEQTSGQADFVTQGMGLPADDEHEDDPWPSSGRSGDRDPGSGSWERDPYGPSSGRAAAATAGSVGAQTAGPGLDLPRRRDGDGELWERARSAVIVLLSVAAVGAVGSAILDSGALGDAADVAASAVSGIGDVAEGPPGDAGPTGSDGGAPAAAGVADTAPPSAAAPQAETGSTTAASPNEAEDRDAAGDSVSRVSDGASFRAVTDSLAAAIEDYGEQIELYREGTIGCPLLMSAREEAGRLFVRLSMFRLSDGARPDSAFRRAYGSFGEDMETVEGTYRQTECPRPSTAPRESAAAGLPPGDGLAADSVEPDGTPDSVSAGVVIDSAPSDPAGLEADTASAGGAAGDTAATGPAPDSTSAAPPADSAASGP